MTPKEKAKSLVGRMERSKDMPYQYAKQCALIAVQELIDQCWSYRDIDLGASFDYWTEVKEEIEKL